jgi:hypothetical protein
VGVPHVFIKTDPGDLAPRERLKRFQRELAETEDFEESRKLLLRYLDPNAPIMPGRVAVTQRQGAGVGGGTVDWRKASTKPGTFDKIRHDLKAPPVIFDTTPPPMRQPLTRVESLTRRYVAEYKRGNMGLLSALLKEAQIEYWRDGSPITMDALERLARKSLQEAEQRAKARKRP